MCVCNLLVLTHINSRGRINVSSRLTRTGARYHTHQNYNPWWDPIVTNYLLPGDGLSRERGGEGAGIFITPSWGRKETPTLKLSESSFSPGLGSTSSVWIWIISQPPPLPHSHRSDPENDASFYKKDSWR